MECYWNHRLGAIIIEGFDLGACHAAQETLTGIIFPCSPFNVVVVGWDKEENDIDKLFVGVGRRCKFGNLWWADYYKLDRFAQGTNGERCE